MVRKIICSAIALLVIAFSSCEKIVVDDSEGTATSKDEATTGLVVKCNLLKTQLTRATTVQASKYAKRIAWALLDTEGKVAYKGEQTSESNVFGSLNINCDPGEYRLIVFATSGKGEINIDENGMVFYTEKQIYESFAAYKDVSVKKNKRTPISMTLDRCVSNFTFHSTDVMPASVSSLHVTYSGLSTKYNVVLGKGDTPTTYERTIPMTGFTGKQLNSSFVLFLPESECTGSIDMQFLDENNNILFDDNFVDAKFMVNHKTVYTGAMFTSAGVDSEELLIATDWGEDININEEALN